MQMCNGISLQVIFLSDNNSDEKSLTPYSGNVRLLLRSSNMKIYRRSNYSLLG